MKITYLVSILSLGVATLAAPSLDPRTGGETTCAQNAGVQACCADNLKQTPSAPLFAKLLADDPRYKSGLGLLSPLIQIFASILAPLTATVGVSQQCSSLGVLAVNPSFVSCGDAQNICCLSPKSVSSNSANGGLLALNFLNGDINFCPSIKVLNL